MKINENEYKQTISQCSDLIVTLGERGAQYKDKLYSTQKVEVVDVCGAGDTFLAALSYYYLKNNYTIESAIIYANKCSAIAVQHRGVYSLTQQDIDVIEND
jgi:D-beta-D-heptose 7-phosphate kinase/D-beta-D-heptose 1-phosphate adenosyltransferase